MNPYPGTVDWCSGCLKMIQGHIFAMVFTLFPGRMSEKIDAKCLSHSLR